MSSPIVREMGSQQLFAIINPNMKAWANLDILDSLMPGDAYIYIYVFVWTGAKPLPELL